MDLRIDAAVTTTVADLSDALAAHLGVPATHELYVDRRGPLTGEHLLPRSGIRDGDIASLDRVTAEAARPTARHPVAELVMVAGPQAGTRVPIEAGESVLGRDPSSTVVVDDPSLSRRHVAIDVAPSGEVTITDAGSSNGTALDGVRLPPGDRRTVTPLDQVEAGRSMFVVQPWRVADETRISPAGFHVAFNRPPRVSRAFEPATLRIQPPPARRRAQRIPMVAAFVPVLMGLALYALTKSPIMLMTAAFTPVMMVGSVVGDRRAGRKEHEAELNAFDQGVAALEQQLDEARRHETVERRAGAPDAGELTTRAVRHLPELWERRPGDGDFLDVRVGVADQPSTTQVVFPDGGDPELRTRVDALIAAREVTPAVPVRVALSEVGAIGLTGPADPTEAAARWLMTQLVTLHSPRDVTLAAAISGVRSAGWSWLDWLPHVSAAGALLDAPPIATDPAAAAELLRRIAGLADERRAENAGGARVRRRPTIVLVVDDELAPERSVVDGLLADCADVDIVAIWMAREQRDLPGGCGAIVELMSGRAACSVTWTASGRVVRDATPDSVSVDVATRTARALAPVVDVTTGSSGVVPRIVALPDLLGLTPPSPSGILERWRTATGLGAPLGMAGDGPLEIDLRRDGPHALIAGTTGAGKSELLQSLVSSLAATHPPDRLAFLLVDYKGGAAFKDCVRLPHTAGMVTDLDEHEVHRALLSLNAELKHREELLAEHGAKDLFDLERITPAAAPPSLAIVIDEFATLAKEVPSFVDGVVDVAQRGRSLGVHLVLATQRPGNVVTENIRANTNLRICLRVAAPSESEDVIGSPDAARLPRSVSGRALVRTGPDELTLFQTAYAGAVSRPDATLEAVVVRPLREHRPRERSQVAVDDPGAVSDLETLVAAIDLAADEADLPRPGTPWLPALPDALAPEEAIALGGPGADDVREGRGVIGVVDEPRRQRRVPLVLDLPADGSLLIYGGGAAGKTTALRTIAATLARQASPRDLQIYGLDFAGRALMGIESLPHCGSVIPGEDEERVGRLIARLRRAIDERARSFARSGVLNLDDHRRRGEGEPLPRIVVLLDSYSGFVDLYEKVDLGAMVDALPRLIADGRAVGVHFVITADRRTAVPTAVASLISRRLVLRMANEDEYAMLGIDPREVIGAQLPAGRCFLEDGREAQFAVFGGETDGIAQTRAIADLAHALSAEHPGETAPPVASIPAEVDRRALPPAGAPLHAMVGIDELELRPLDISLQDMHFAVIGPYRSGRSTALGTVWQSLRESTPEGRFHLLAPRRSPLEHAEGWASVAHGPEECEDRVGRLLDELLADDSGVPVVVVMDDAGELAESAAQSTLEQLLKRGRDRSLRVVASLETGQARHYAAWIRELRKDGHGLLLDPNMDIDGDLLSVRLPRKTNPLHLPGRGYLVAGGQTTAMQVAKDL